MPQIWPSTESIADVPVLRSVDYMFIAITPRSTLVIPIKIPSIGQIYLC